MIERATARRLAGDWRGACAAANVDVAFDLADIRRDWGAVIAAEVETDLGHLVPDLMRWHMPRYLRGRTTIHPNRTILLARYGDDLVNSLYLYVGSLRMVDGTQRLTLQFGWIGDAGRESRKDWRSSRPENWITSRHLWDARYTDELRERCGGGDRAPFHNRDGTRRDEGDLPLDDPGRDDPAAYAEWVTLLRELGEPEQAFGVAGITLDQTPPQVRYSSPPRLLDTLARLSPALTRLAPEMTRLADAGFGRSFRIASSPSFVFVLLELDQQPRWPIGLGGRRFLRPRAGLGIRLAASEEATDAGPLPEACWKPLPDLELLRHGLITPDRLHPLVSASLFPGRAVTPKDGPPDPELPVPVRVRCRGEWHEVRSTAGRLEIPHPGEEQRREQAMRAFGGPVAGCFATQQAWTSGVGRLPRALRAQRLEFFEQIQHGGTPALLQLLDAGADPRIRDGRQRTLLHLLHVLDWQEALPRLLAAGLDLEARDHHRRTPLLVAVGEGPVGLVRALLAAGARIDVVDHQNQSLVREVFRQKRSELRFLADAIVRDYPGLVPKSLVSRWEDLDF